MQSSVKILLNIVCLVLVLGVNAQDGAHGSDKIKLFLTSNAPLVLDELASYLPFAPDGKHVCYITTAGHHAPWVYENIKKIEDFGFNVKPVDLASLNADDLATVFDESDIIWVGGGNTFYLLQEVRRSGFDKYVTRRILEGTPYVGTSAGSIILGPNIELAKFADDVEEAPELTSYAGLNIFPLIPLVHFDHPDYKEVYKLILNFALEHDVPVVSLKEHQFIYVDGVQWQVIDGKR